MTENGADGRIRRMPVVMFTALAWGLAWLVMLPIWLTGGVDSTLPVSLFVWVMMFTPTIAAMVTMFATRSPGGQRLRSLGLWPLRPARRVVLMTVAAIFIPILVAILVIIVDGVTGWLRLDLANLSGLQANIDQQLQELDPETREAAQSELLSPWLVVTVQFLVLPLAAIPNTVLGLGEELGWRGWLLPALRPLGIWPAMLVSGVIWGIWHAPVTLLGHNYGLLDARGVLLMIVNCVIWGMLFGWLRLRTGSVWPVAFAHGALNAVGTTPLLFAAAGEEMEPAIASLAGLAGWLVVGAIVTVLWIIGQFRVEPELGRRPAKTESADQETGPPR